jgi:hypothetical protein
MKAAFGGYLGSKMKKKAKQWAKETPHMENLPEHAKKMKKKKMMIAKRVIDKG